MAKAKAKPQKGEKMAVAESLELRAVRLELPSAVHDRLRILAAEQRLPMSQLVRLWVLALVEDSGLRDRTTKAGAKFRED